MAIALEAMAWTPDARLIAGRLNVRGRATQLGWKSVGLLELTADGAVDVVSEGKWRRFDP
jgi:hypothetical protein